MMFIVIHTMAPKAEDKNTYKDKIKLGFERLKIIAANKIKIDLIKLPMKSLATEIGVLSQDVKLFMILPKTNRHYALNDRTINVLMKGQIDENAVTGGEDDPEFSDVEMGNFIEQETEVSITVVKIGDDEF